MQSSTLLTTPDRPPARPTATRVPDQRRERFLPQSFGPRHFLRGEQLVYSWMARLSPDYSGGYWHFYEVSNGAFFMVPNLQVQRMRVEVPSNFYSGCMSREAAGVVCVLFAINAMTFAGADHLCDAYHLLRSFAVEHAEAAEILAAID
jgi:hypothetical protein